MSVHLVNPNDNSFGIGIIVPRWLYVLASATPEQFGIPSIVDETLDAFDPSTVSPGDVVGIGIHTLNALRGYELGKMARERGGRVIYGGVHASLDPEEPVERGAASAVVRGDGDIMWGQALSDNANGSLQRIYDGGRLEADRFFPAKWELLPGDRYMMASVQTVRGCPKHCSFCSVWRTDGQKPRQRASDAIVEEAVQLRRMGFRFILLADDNFYPVTKHDLELAAKRKDTAKLEELTAIRDERFELMERLSKLPHDMVFLTQITMEAADDPEYLQAMKRARVKGALVGVESVTAEGLKAVYKDFNSAGDNLVEKLRTFVEHDVHILGSFIFGLPTDRPETFGATASLAQAAGIDFAQFVTLTPFPGTVDFLAWEKSIDEQGLNVDGIPLNRFWLIPRNRRPKLYLPHPAMTNEEIRVRTQEVWNRFYRLPAVWKRSSCTRKLRDRIAYVLISKLFPQMYANTGLATDSARAGRARQWARWIAKPCRRVFTARPMPELQVPA
ncbi:MAG TPA: radical SAM protein [Vicinamibacteria bacterium]|nr:radical SAM protein [Vicinamibacteria bacterium]